MSSEPRHALPERGPQSVASVDILMYHSISNAPGPTSIAPEIFKEQMALLASSDIEVLKMDDVLDHLAVGQKRAVAITFDDGFKDFMDVAWPILCQFDLPAIVYLPTDHIGKVENWTGSNHPARPLLSWDDVRVLKSEGVVFGNHTLSHPDLSRLTGDALCSEVDRASERIAEEIGAPPTHFAAPYGSWSPHAHRVIARHHKTSVSTNLGPADMTSDPFQLPRIEMFYYRDARKWNSRLEGSGELYLRSRQIVRSFRAIISRKFTKS